LSITEQDKLNILITEYNSLYSLYTFRIQAIEKRLPMAAVILSAFLGVLTTLPSDVRIVFYIGIPISLIYVLRTASIHVRSFEDSLRRIDEIENQINNLVGENLIRFQSNHPSKVKTVGGRTSRELILSIMAMTVLVIFACIYLYALEDYDRNTNILYVTLLIVIMIFQLQSARQLFQYKYIPEHPHGSL